MGRKHECQGVKSHNPVLVCVCACIQPTRSCTDHLCQLAPPKQETRERGSKPSSSILILQRLASRNHPLHHDHPLEHHIRNTYTTDIPSSGRKGDTDTPTFISQTQSSQINDIMVNHENGALRRRNNLHKDIQARMVMETRQRGASCPSLPCFSVVEADESGSMVTFNRPTCPSGRR